jgi:hypothetical protein
MKLKLTKYNLQLTRVLRNDKYMSNSFFMIVNEFEPKNIKKVETTQEIPAEVCQKIVDRAMEGAREDLTKIGLNYYSGLVIDYKNSKGEITRLNAYFVELSNGQVPSQTEYKNMPVVVMLGTKFVGLIMPININ